MSKTLKIIFVLALVIALAIPTGVSIVKAHQIPTFSIVSVVPGAVVTIETSDFPAEMEFDVLIGRYGTYGLDGVKVATQNSDKGGTFTATFDIPEELKSVEMLSIRLENKETGYYAYNWFKNAVVPSTDTTPEAVATGTASGTEGDTEAVELHPSFTITSVQMDKSITVQGVGFPKDTEYDVLMGVFGSMGMGGVKSATQKTGAKGEFKATYTIPEEFAGAYMISVRMESTASIYYAYNYFYNSTYTPAEETTAVATSAAATPATVTATEEATTYSGYPYFSITKVVKNTTVSIMAENLPEGEVFDVMMSNYLDDSFEPIKAGTLDASKGGSMESSFTIPEALKDVHQIAVRLTGTKTGYFAYNFFYNETFPLEPTLAPTEATVAPTPTTAATKAPTAVPPTATAAPAAATATP